MVNQVEVVNSKLAKRGTVEPLVTVIVPCYNHESYVEACIRSIINQDYGNIELIIIDDGSKDGSQTVIEEMIPECESRFVRFSYRSRENKGLCATLNEAVEWAQGEFLSPIASDDILYTNKVSRQITEYKRRVLERPDLVAIYSGVEFIDNNGGRIKVKRGSGKFCGFKGVILRTEFLPTPTFLVKTGALVSVGGFDPKHKIEDFYMRLKLTDNGGLFFVMGEPLVKYRRHDDNLSAKSDIIWAGVTDILTEYIGRDIYKKALAMSMMVQAHDYQQVSRLKGCVFAVRAFKLCPAVIFTQSMLRFAVKMIYKG